VACTTLDGTPVAVTASDDETVRIWDLTTGTERAILTGHTDTVTKLVACTTLAGTPVAVTASDDQTVRVWDLRTGQTINAHALPYAVNCVAIGPSGEVIVGAGHEVIGFAPLAKSAQARPT
jgi:WD40 repeat protein